MTKEEIDKVFMFLEKEMNMFDNIYFKMNASCNINAYFKNEKGNLEIFAEFYTSRILKYLKEKESD